MNLWWSNGGRMVVEWWSNGGRIVNERIDIFFKIVYDTLGDINEIY